MDRFLLLRDFTGLIQILYEEAPRLQLPLESVLQVSGLVRRRPPRQVNPAMGTGQIEVVASDFKVISRAESAPFSIGKHLNVSEKIKHQYRYVDLRSPRLQQNLRFRSQFTHHLRRCLVEDLSFVDIETPTLFRQSPGGAQEFVVPTTNTDPAYKAKFYSLPQSPQLLKQLLMIGGFDRYFQIARCYRDEGLASDKQPEFTQLDLEMSFVEAADVMQTVEGLLRSAWPKHLPQPTFTRLTYAEAIHQYGTDKPDLRYKQTIRPFSVSGVAIVQNGLCLRFRNSDPLFSKSKLSRLLSGWAKESIIFNKLLTDHKLYFIIFHSNDSIQSNARMTNEDFSKLITALNLEPGEICFFTSADDHDSKKLSNAGTPYRLLGEVRTRLIPEMYQDNISSSSNKFVFVWLDRFPLFARNQRTNHLESCHHPFTAPIKDHFSQVYKDPESVLADHYDLVLNGHEIGGGSIRIIDPELQRYVLGDILQLDPSHFSYFLSALCTGVPPHGGFALGLDRLCALLAANDSTIRDVIAFPKSLQGSCPMCNTPTGLNDETLLRYKLR